jgi:eukaryotic-like serine/threonine-protein kinase
MPDSYTCRDCLIQVASVSPDTGLCDSCTRKETGASRPTTSSGDPTASFSVRVTAESATTNLYGDAPAAARRAPIPFGYDDEQYLDEGGMGQVFRATELSTGRTVAIKMLHSSCMTDDLIARFSVEAKALAALKHPNLVFLYEFQERARPPYLVMEYVDGTSAYARLKAEGRFPVREAVQVIRQAALGVHAAHQHNVIHRDIKPSNLLIDKQGVVKLTDFGLAKRLNERDDLTIHGGIAGGTPGYMAPEQVNPMLGDITVASDVWGLGATLYCLLAGRPPYPSNRNDVLAVLMKDHQPVQHHRAEVSPVLDAIVHKCLMFEPGERYASAEALAQDLDSYLNDRPTVVRPPSFVGRVWNTARNLQTATVVAWSLALLVLCIIGASFFAKKPKSLDDRRKEYFAECRAKLQRGETVTLIQGDGGELPEFVEWPFVSYPLSKPLGGIGCVQLVTSAHGLAVLLDDPGIDSYTLRGEFKYFGSGMKNAQDNRDLPATHDVGLAIGLTQLKRASGKVQDSFMTWKYQEGAATNKDGTKSAMMRAQSLKYGPNGHLDFDPVEHDLGSMSFVPSESIPGPWRYLEMQVSRDDVVSRIGFKDGTLFTANKAAPKPTPDWWREMLNLELVLNPNPPGDSYVNLDWNPCRPLGIWCDSSSVLVRNVEIAPLAAVAKR